MDIDIEKLNQTELFLLTYCFCAWVSFGVYAVSDTTWTCKEAFAKTIHGANTGIILGLLGLSAGLVMKGKPYQLISLACSGSIGWVTKDRIMSLLTKMIAGEK